MTAPTNNFTASPKQPEHKDALNQFVSLGINCELGMVQQKCDADPLGLFRFGLTPLAGLIDALDCDFENLLNLDYLKFPVSIRDEYMAVHQRYEFEFHTYINRHAKTEAEVTAKMLVHFGYLTRILREQLESGEKIFAYRPKMKNAPLSDAIKLSAALRRFGPVVLMWAAWTDDPALVGTVYWLVPGQIIVGYLDHYAPLQFAANASIAVWIEICNAAIDLRANHDAQALCDAAPIDGETAP